MDGAILYFIYRFSWGSDGPSPFFSYSLNDLNTNESSQYANKDYLASDDWVFIKKDFGSALTSTDFPFIFLYNKHSGTLRLFLALGQLYGQNDAATITLTYNNNTYRFAIFENYKTIGSALKDFDNNVSSVTINNYYNNSVLFWYHADFTINYDPCICNYPSSLLFQVKFLSKVTMQFTLDGSALPQIDGYGRVGRNGNVNSTIAGAATSVFNNAQKATKIFGDAISGISKWADLTKAQKTFYDNLGSVLNGISPIFGAVSFLIGLFGGGNDSPVRPVAYDINLEGSGSINYSNPYGSIALPVPGANKSGLDPMRNVST